MTDRVLGHTAALLRLIAVSLLVVLSAPAGAQDASEIGVSVVRYGVGNTPRAGEWMGVQVEILDSASEQRDIILRLSVRDADGDRAMYDRVVTANPGVAQSFWLYARLPYTAEQEPPGVTVFEAIEADTETGYRAGRLLGRVDTPPSVGNQILPPMMGAIGVIGPYPAGLEQYNFTMQNRPAAPFGHELARVTAGLDVPTLPDQWHGLVPFEVLLWAEATSRTTEPMGLTPERANALRTWVERGGHLVILLPPAGDPWFAAQHALTGMLPDIQRPERREGVNLNTIRPLLTESLTVPLPDNAVLHTFSPRAGAAPHAAQRVLDLPDGGTVVIRRIVGAGAVTVVGLDLTAGPMRRFGLPDAESLWHRVLGRRGEIRTIDELTDQEKAFANSARREMEFDHDIASTISSTGSAVQGVLFGVVVFISYWVVAGPLGFMLLRRRGLHQHAWVAFVACTAVFTGLAWLGATVMRPKRISYTHLTLFEQIHGQDTARARTWASVMLPSYGVETLSLRAPDSGASRARTGAADLLAPWEPSGNLAGWSKGFPDNSGYRVESRSPDTLTVPTRATIKQVRADVAGVSSWGGIGLQSDPGSLTGPRIVRDGLRLEGVLVHDLPGPMTDVRVFVNPGQTRILPAGTALAGGAISAVTVLAPQFDGRAWLPGQPLDLGAITAAATTQTRSFDYFRTAVRDGTDTGAFTGVATAGTVADRLTAVRFLSQFAPPNYRDDRDTVGNRLARRVATHGWDLGRWMTTPSVIVTGFIEIPERDASAGGAPFPLFVDGRAAPASGLTMVTWIYPLPDDPPRWPAATDAPVGAPAGDEANQTPPSDD